MKRLVLAGVLTIALCAVSLLPIFSERHLIGGHPDDPTAGGVNPITFLHASGLYFNTLPQWIWGDTVERGVMQLPGNHFYFSYVTPPWFLGLILLALPPIAPWLHRPGIRGMGRIWIVGLLFVLFFTLWGMGGHPLLVWLYENVPGMAQWRFVGRALAVSSFWVGVLVALRFDTLLRALLEIDFAPFKNSPRRILRWAKYVPAALLIVAAAMAARSVLLQWNNLAHPAKVFGIETIEVQCLTWLREQYPDATLSAWRMGYDVTTAFLDTRVRVSNIAADFFPLAIASTYGNFDEMRYAWQGEFGIPVNENERAFMTENAYAPIENSPPRPENGEPCLWRQTKSLPYAYSVPLFELQQSDMPGDFRITQDMIAPVTAFTQYPGVIAIRYDSQLPIRVAVTAQERAFPGWTVTVNGEAAPLESIGGQLGVVIGPEEGSFVILFEYRPPLLNLGGAITLLAALFCVGYLLRIRFQRGR